MSEVTKHDIDQIFSRWLKLEKAHYKTINLLSQMTNDLYALSQINDGTITFSDELIDCFDNWKRKIDEINL